MPTDKEIGQLTLFDITTYAGTEFIPIEDGAGANWKMKTGDLISLAIVKAYLQTLPGYDNTKSQALCTKGDGTNSFVWLTVGGL